MRVIRNHTKCLKKQCHGSLASKFKDVIDILFQRIHVCANLGKFTSNHNFRNQSREKNAVERMAEIYMIASWIYLFHCFLSENNLASRSWVEQDVWCYIIRKQYSMAFLAQIGLTLKLEEFINHSYCVVLACCILCCIVLLTRGDRKINTDLHFQTKTPWGYSSSII